MALTRRNVSTRTSFQVLPATYKATTPAPINPTLSPQPNSAAPAPVPNPATATAAPTYSLNPNGFIPAKGATVTNPDSYYALPIHKSLLPYVSKLSHRYLAEINAPNVDLTKLKEGDNANPYGAPGFFNAPQGPTGLANNALLLHISAISYVNRNEETGIVDYVAPGPPKGVPVYINGAKFTNYSVLEVGDGSQQGRDHYDKTGSLDRSWYTPGMKLTPLGTPKPVGIGGTSYTMKPKPVTSNRPY